LKEHAIRGSWSTVPSLVVLGSCTNCSGTNCIVGTNCVGNKIQGIGKKFLKEFNKNMVAIHEQVEMYGRNGDKAVKNVHFSLYMEQQYYAWDLTTWYYSSEAAC